MKRVLTSLVPVIFLAASCSHSPRRPESAEAFHLFKNGRPMATIVVPEGTFDPVKAHMSPTGANRMIPADVPSDLARAVEEFRRDLREGYGVVLPVCATGEKPSGTASELPNRLEIVVEERPLSAEDDVTIDFPAENTMRITGGESGVRRGLFRLLEEFGGARYLFQGSRDDIGFGAYFPKRDVLGIPRETLTWSSAFPLYRGSSQTTYGSNWPGLKNRAYFWNWEARLGAKARTANSHMRIPFPLERYAESGEKPDEDIFPILHGERYLAWKHPKVYWHWQPRYGSPAAIDEAVKNILAYLRENPNVTSIALGVNDSGGHCETERGREGETYYRWVNQVAERVTREFPDVVFTTYAYREVASPPKFKLHPNVVSILCFGTHSCLDPEARARREKLIRDWSEVARIGHYGYDNGDIVYTLPRIYFGITQDMIRFLRDHGCEHAFCERSYTTATEGPKMYLYFKLLENPDADLEAILRDWCEAAVGKEAAEPLRDYYAFWEDFWLTKAVHTGWFKNGKNSIYLPYQQFGSYMYALEPGDMARCRTLMERVVELADANGTEDQKKRAAFLMAAFEWNEANAVATGAKFISPDGTLSGPEAATALLQSVPAAQAAAEKSFRLPYETTGWLAPGVTSKSGPRLPEDTTGRNADVVTASMALVANFLDDEDVQNELSKLSKNKELVPSIRFLAETLLRAAKGDDSGNMVEDGIFETDDHGWNTSHPVHGKVSRSDDVAFRGKNSLKCDIDHANFMIEKRVLKAEPDTPYFFSARVLIPADQPVAEGRLNIRGSVTYRMDGQFINRNHTANIPDVVLKSGQWNYVSCVIPPADLRKDRGVDSLALRLHLKRFERGDVAYVDDVQVYPIKNDQK